MKYFFTRFIPVLAAFLMLSTTVNAQFTVSGTVTDADGETLIGVSVIVKGTASGTVTDLDGMYVVSINKDPSTLEFSYVGFAAKNVVVTAANEEMDVVMSDDATNLDEIVVTGLASSVKRSNSANSVASVPASELAEIAVPTTALSALYGKAKGTDISATSGAPGGGTGIKLRGVTSLSGSSQPLFIIDGIYLDNSSIPAGLNAVSAAAGGGSQSNQDNPSNRLADIDPNDFESVEILKGPSAAAIYGSRASGGVIIITTKRGKAGETKVKIAQDVGFTEMLNPLGVRQFTREKLQASDRYSSPEALALFDEAIAGPGLINYEDKLYGNTGVLANTRVEVSGGNEKTRFFIGASHKDEEGIVQNTGYRKTNGRLNLNHKVSDWLDIDFSNFFVNSSADRGFFNNDNSGTTMGVSFLSTPSFVNLNADPTTGVFPDNPYAPSNFLQSASLIKNNESVNRLLSGLTATAKLHETDNTSLKLMLRGGLDSYTLRTFAYFPNELQFMQLANGGINGTSIQGSTTNFNTNVSAFLVLSNFTDSGINFRTQLGTTAENFNRNTILGTSQGLIGGQTNLSQGGSRDVTQSRVLQKDRGFFVQEEVNIQDKVILSAGIRGDKSTNNGDVNKLFFYPKASVALNLHEFGVLPEGLSALKLRAAFGQSGNFANFGSKYTSFNTATVNGLAGSEVGDVKGNDIVSPERQSEIELGFDLGLVNNRVLVDFTYYNRTVNDLLLNAALPPSSGFSSEIVNAADLVNKGVEIGLDATIIRNANLKWNARVSWWKNTSEVTRLDVPAFTTGGFADFLGNLIVKEGLSPTTIIGIGPDPTITLNGDGEPTLQVYGNAEPDFQMSLLNSLKFGNFDFTFIFHWKSGGSNINLSTLLFDLNETTHDFDDTDLDPEGVLNNGNYRLSLLGASTEPYVQDASYLRMREAGLYYNVPSTIFKDKGRLRIGVSGTNLINIFTYDSYDPEVSNFGSAGLSTGVEVSPFPSAKRYNFHVSVTF